MTRTIFILVFAVPAFAETPRSLAEYDVAVREFCLQRDALTQEAKAASEKQTAFALESAITVHQQKLRKLSDRADELRQAAGREVLYATLRDEARGVISAEQRASLPQLTSQLDACAAFDDGFIAWARERRRSLDDDSRRDEAQQASNEAYELHIARGVTDPKSFDERVVQITPPDAEQTVALFLAVNPSRFVFARRKIDEAGAHRAIAAGEALLLTRVEPAKVLTLDGMQLDVEVNALSLTPMKGLKAAPIEPTWLFVSNDEGSGGYRDIHNTWDGDIGLSTAPAWMKLAPLDDADINDFIDERQRVTECTAKRSCSACGCKTFQTKKRAHAKKALEALQTRAFQPLIPVVARLTGLFPTRR